MPYRKVQDLSVQVEPYEGPDGNVKYKYQTVGSVLRDETGKELLLINRTFNPAGVYVNPNKPNSNQVPLFRFDVRSREEQQSRRDMAAYDRRVAGKNPDDIPFDDDIPF